MALLDNYSENNKVETTALEIRYNLVGESQGHYWESHRYVTKQWSYVGMTKQAAIACRDDMAEELTRLYKIWVSDNGVQKYYNASQLRAEVQATHEQGDMWRVDISVNDDDVEFTTVIPVDVSALPFPALPDILED